MAIRDVKPANLLVDSNFSISKMCDFGSLRCSNEATIQCSNGVANGTSLRYSGCEVYKGTDTSIPFYQNADIFSLSCVIVQLFIEKNPYHSIHVDGELLASKASNPHIHAYTLKDIALVPKPYQSILQYGLHPTSFRPSIQDFVSVFIHQKEFVPRNLPKPAFEARKDNDWTLFKIATIGMAFLASNAMVYVITRKSAKK